MPITWPTTLPSALRAPQPEEPTDTRAIFQPDLGPVHIARTSTAEPNTISVELLMSESQYALLQTFYVTTCSGGVADFEWDSPWYGSGTKTFRFLSKPAVSWSRPMNVPTSASTKSIHLVGAAANPQRIGTVTFRLQELPWFPVV